jgi:hypothetical protein
VSETALTAWVTRLWDDYSQMPPEVDGKLVRVALDAGKVSATGGTLNVGPGVSGYSLLLEDMNQGRMELIFGDPLPPRVIAHVRSGVDDLRLTVPDGQLLFRVELLLDDRDNALDLRAGSVTTLTVKGGQFNAQGRPPQNLDLEDTNVQLSEGISTLTLRGDVRAGHSISATQAYVGFATVGGREWHFRELLPLGEDPPRLQVVTGSVILGWVSDGADLWCERGASLELGRGNGTEPRPLRSLLLFAGGRVHVHGVLQTPRFGPTPLPADLNVIGAVLDAEGRVRLEAARGAVVSGSPDGTLVLDGFVNVQGAELEDVNVYDLNIGDLLTLEGAERVEPWVPRPQMARRAEDAMFRDQDPRLAQRQRMHFWSRMTDILKLKKAPGRLQSEVRYAAQRARNNALPMRRERALLTAYSLVGYGERILLPLGWYLLVGLVLTVWFSAPDRGEEFSFAQTTGQRASR